MAKKEIALEFSANTTQVEGGVKSLKAQLREAQAEVAAMADKFGATSKQAIDAAKRAGELKDKIGDAKALTDAYNPDAKFKAFGAAIQGVTGGFAALQGAQALFGSKSEELEKTLVKVQGAMALTQGLNSVMEAKDSFVNLAGFIKTNVVAAFGTLRNAIISTGIGALAIGIGLVIANFEKLKNSGGLVGKIFRGIGDAITWVTDKLGALTDWLGITGDEEENLAAKSERASERMKKAKEAAYDNELRLAKAVGKGVEEIEKKKRDEQIKTLEAQIAAYEFAQKSAVLSGLIGKEFIDDTLTNFKIEIDKLKTDAKIADVEAQKKREEAAKKAAEDKKKKDDETKKALEDERKKQEELNKIRFEAKQAESKFLEDWAKNQADEDQKNFDNEQKRIANNEQTRLSNRQKLAALNIANDPNSSAFKIAKLQADLEAENSLLDANDLQRQVNAQNTANAITKIKEDEAKRQEEIEKMKVMAVANSLGAISDLIGQDTAAGKALGVAQAIINTYVGATEALRQKSTLPQPFATIQKIASVAAIIATGLKTVKQITSVKVPGKGGGGGMSVPSGMSAAVAAPITPQAQTTMINQAQINQIGNAAVRSYVLDRDIENNRDRITRLNRAARIN